MENLLFVPLGQDSKRKRYWVIDGPYISLFPPSFQLFACICAEQRACVRHIAVVLHDFVFSEVGLPSRYLLDSPRVYMSTNPWKITAAFQAVCSTRDEYLAMIEKLKSTAPSEPKFGERRSKPEQAHLNLLKAMEDRVPAIDAAIVVSCTHPKLLHGVAVRCLHRLDVTMHIQHVLNSFSRGSRKSGGKLSRSRSSWLRQKSGRHEQDGESPVQIMPTSTTPILR